MSKHIDLLRVYENLDLEVYMTLKEGLAGVDRQHAEEQFEKFGIVYGDYAGLAVVAKQKVEQAEKDLSYGVAKIKEEIRNSSIKKIPATTLQDMAEATEEYSKYQDALILAETKFGFLKALLKALDIKHNALIQTTSTKRAETKLYS